MAPTVVRSDEALPMKRTNTMPAKKKGKAKAGAKPEMSTNQPAAPKGKPARRKPKAKKK